jgi:hypothetical protein
MFWMNSKLPQKGCSSRVLDAQVSPVQVAPTRQIQNFIHKKRTQVMDLCLPLPSSRSYTPCNPATHIP